jgi:acyl carrier protein
MTDTFGKPFAGKRELGGGKYAMWWQRAFEMTPDEVSKTVCRIISEQLDVPGQEIDPDKTLEHDLLFDDLTLIEVVLALESHFEVEIDDETYNAWITVADVIKSLQAIVKP